MCEIETARVAAGTDRWLRLLHRTIHGKPSHRSLEGIKDEISALAKSGAAHFRIGRQPDILTWQAGSGEFPVPRPEMIERLFSSIRACAPSLQTLHIDNVNPGTIARHPQEAYEALDAIVRYHTPGDVAAGGMETADPAVIEENNLKATPEMMMDAIRRRRRRP